MIKICLSIAFSLFLISALLLAGDMDYEDAFIEEIRYCNDVALWRHNQMTTGSKQFGHPDYKGIYAEVCRKYEPQDQLLIAVDK